MSRLGRGILIPLAAFLVARGFLSLAAAASGRSPWQPLTWCENDTAHYLSIARGGYLLASCGPEDPPPGRCGNAGWMPGYPIAVRAVVALGLLHPRRAAVLVSAAFALATLVFLWNAWLARRPRDGVLLLLLAAFYPGQVYHHGGFPLAQFTLFALVALWLAGDGRWLLSGCAAAGAALTYATGFLLSPVLLVDGLVRTRARGGEAMRAVAGAALAFGGFAGLLAFHWLTLGAWDAFFRVQSHYGHALGNPLATWWGAVRPAFSLSRPELEQAKALQTLLVAALAIAALAVAARRREAGSLLLVLYLAAFWSFPLAMGEGVSLYRAEATLLPTVLLLRGAPRPVLGTLLAACAAVAWPMALLYFRLRLV